MFAMHIVRKGNPIWVRTHGQTQSNESKSSLKMKDTQIMMSSRCKTKMTSVNKQGEDKVHRFEGKFTRNVKRKNSGTDSILGRTRDVGQARNECSPLHNLICERESEFERSAKISQSILPEHPLQKRTCQKNE